MKEDFNMHVFIPSFVPKFSIFLFVLFAILKKANVVDWNFWWVASPIWGCAAFYLLYYVLINLFLISNRKFFREIFDKMNKFHELEEAHAELKKAYESLQKDFDNAQEEYDELKEEYEELEKKYKKESRK